jgi:hypothetical protein
LYTKLVGAILHLKKLFLFVCIGLLLLSSFPLLYVRAQTTLFSDGFESGNFSAWTGAQSHSSGVTASVQTAPVNEGTHSMRIAVADAAGEHGVCEYKDLGAGYNSIDARVYLQLSAKPAADTLLEIFGFSSNG